LGAEGEGAAIRTLIAPVVLVLSLSLSSTATAAPLTINVPAGPLGAAVNAIARRGGLSISISERRLLLRRVPAIRGRMEPTEALARAAAAGGLRVQRVGANSFVLVALPFAKPKPRLPVIAKRRPAPPVAPPPSENPDVIIVTASKRDTPSPRFAGQWVNMNGREFGSLGVAGAEAIEARSVGFSSTHLGAGRNKLFIRGIADSSFSGPTQSPVGQYFGDMRTTYSGPDPDLKLVDMQSVEILEGPQGTLYGSGALGGIILLKPEKPRFGELSGRALGGATATQHGDAGYDFTAILNAPVADNAALRVVAYRSLEGGYVDNRATGEENINDVDVRGGRAILSAEVRADWFVDLAGVAQTIEGADSQYADVDGSGLSRSSLIEQPFSSDFRLANLVVRKDRGMLRFQTTTGAGWQDVEETFDASTADQMRRLRQRSKSHALSNETRMWRPMTDGYSWLLGFSSIVHRYRIDRDIERSGDVVDLSGAENKVREFTLYGEAGIQIDPRIELSVGARYTHSRISGSGEHLSPLVATRLAEEDPVRRERTFLPTFAILARPMDQLTLYARYQRGFRPGGLSIAGDTVRLYRNDRLATAEAGFRFGQKGRDRFDLQGGATYSRWNDIQADFLDPSGLPVTDNIGDGRVWTVSLNGGVQLSRALRLDGGFAWNDGQITKPAGTFRTLVAAASVANDAMEIPNIARVVSRAGVTWQRELGPDWTLEANAYGRYVGKSRLGIGPRLGDSQGSYVDSGLVVRVAEGRRALSLSVTNLTDEVGNRFAFGAPLASGADQITPLRPRTIRLGLEQAF